MLQIVAIAIAIAIVGLVVAIVTRPATFRIERATSIAAPPAAVFRYVDDFHEWAAWSPWEKLDPQMTKTFEGPASGVGAGYAWKGNDKVGEGRMTILKSEPPSLLAIELQFFKPYSATNLATFTFEPEASGTRVTWAMDGKNNFMGKAMSLFLNLDRLVGTDFARGLAALKQLAESSAKAPA